jgi:WD40 repeat protein
MQEKKYRGFISYIYQDTNWFNWLKKVLDGYKPSAKIIKSLPNLSPFLNKKVKVFNDRMDFDPESDIIESEKKAIDKSDNLFIVCSKESRFSYEINENAKYGLSESYKGKLFFILIDNKNNSGEDNPADYLPQYITPLYLKNPAIFEGSIIDLRGLSKDKLKKTLLSGLSGIPENEFKSVNYLMRFILPVIIIFIMALFYWFILHKDIPKGKKLSYSGNTLLARSGKPDAMYINDLIGILKNSPDNSSSALELLNVLTEKVYPEEIGLKKDTLKEECIISGDHSFMLHYRGNTAALWDLKNKKLFYDFDLFREKIIDAGFSPDDKFIFTITSDGGLKIWDAGFGSQVSNISNENKIIRAAFGFSGSGIIALYQDNTFGIWNYTDGKPIKDPIKMYSKVLDFEITQSGNLIIAYLENKKTCIINLNDNLPAIPAWLLDMASIISLNRGNRIIFGTNHDFDILNKIISDLYREPAQDLFTEWGRWFLDRYLSKIVFIPDPEFFNQEIFKKIDPVLIKKLQKIYSNPENIGNIITNALAYYLSRGADLQPDYSEIIIRYLLDYSIRLYPLNPELWYNKGIFEYDNDNLAGAFPAFYKSIFLKPDFWESWNYIGNLWTDLGTRKNSANALKRSLDIAIRKSKGFTEYDYNTIGSLLMDLDERQYSLLAFKKELERNRYLENVDDPNAKEMLAISYGNLAFAELFNMRAKEAILSSLQGLKTDSTQLWLNINLSHSYVLNNQFKKAREIYIKYGNMKLYEYDNKTLGEIILGDLDDLKKNGFYHPDMEKIIKFFSMKSKPQ